jgi:hypothetical protein
MTLLDYANWVPLPAPVTSGSGIQTFIDPCGDVWVAANGVNSGAWRRARDVLHARYYRNAAWTCSAGAWISINMDTASFDDYGLYSTSTGLFTPPLTGFWRLTFQASATATATGQWFQPGIWETSPGVTAADVLAHTSVAYAIRAVVTTARRITTLTDTYYSRVACSAALAGQVGSNTTFFEMDYVGTG